MQPIEQISDFQLYALNHNQALRGGLLQMIAGEYERRAFTTEYIEQLRADYDNRCLADSSGLKFIHKALIIATAPTVPVNVIVMLVLAKGNPTIQKQFWTCLIIGHAMLIIIAIALAHYLLR